MSAALIIILGIWLMLSILAQFDAFHWVRWFQERDYFALIPDWSFFAPDPMAGDFQLLYRDKLFDGQFTPWKEVKFRNAPLLRAIWNPEKRRRKAMINAETALLQMVARNPKSKMLFVSLPYLITLISVTTLPRSTVSDYRQFLIAHTFGYHTSKEAEILFLSPAHKL
jgi:signal transduction histidine kinase